jgi:hypothetical protein
MTLHSFFPQLTNVVLPGLNPWSMLCRLYVLSNRRLISTVKKILGNFSKDSFALAGHLIQV